MVQLTFLDTNVMLDYLENRNKEVRDLIAQLLLVHKKGTTIQLATSVFNVAELIDKEFEIQFIGDCLKKQMSFDEIQRQKSNVKIFQEMSSKNKDQIEKKIKSFISDEQIVVLPLDVENQYEEVLQFIYQRNLNSQDALIVKTAIINGVTYFLSNDTD